MAKKPNLPTDPRKRFWTDPSHSPKQGIKLSNEERLERLESELSNINELFEMFASDVIAPLAFSSNGLDIRTTPYARLIAIDIFLSSSTSKEIGFVEESLANYCASLGFPIAYQFSGIKGSWYRRFIGKSHETLTSEEVRERLRKAERGVELRVLQKPQAEADHLQGEALSGLITSLDKIQEAAILIGSLLLLKTTSENGRSVIVSRCLSTHEIIALERNPNLLGSPGCLLNSLKDVCAQAGG